MYTTGQVKLKKFHIFITIGNTSGYAPGDLYGHLKRRELDYITHFFNLDFKKKVNRF